MQSGQSGFRSLPFWTWLIPVTACAFLLAKHLELIGAGSGIVVALTAILIGGAIFAAVHHAEVIALRAGEPYGSIVLAVAVTVIEVALILSIMAERADGGQALARDTVFATVMIVLNGVAGFCLVLGGARHYEQVFNTTAASAALSVLGTLAVLTLILPNYTLATDGPTFNPQQLWFVSCSCLALYCVFLFVQTIRHRDYFLTLGSTPESEQTVKPTNIAALASLALLLAALVAVVILSKSLSPNLEAAVSYANLPKSFVGVIIATVVLMPESVAALRAAARNRLQTSLNLALGSAIATIGLTIPVVSAFALLNGQTLVLGLDAEAMVLLILSLFMGTVTLATGRTTILQGAVHLVIFAVFLFLAATP